MVCEMKRERELVVAEIISDSDLDDMIYRLRYAGDPLRSALRDLKERRKADTSIRHKTIKDVADMLHERSEYVLSKQDGKIPAVDTQLRMMVVILQEIEEELREQIS
jgi:hypothetical protein